MTILDPDTIAPATKKPARGPNLRRWCRKFGVAFALTFAVALVAAPTVITEVVINNEYNDYL